jgi:ketosteroid isomerase-like protein
VTDDKLDQARQVMRSFEMGDEWFDAIDPEAPEWVREWQGGSIRAYRDADIDWVLEQTDPEVEISQPVEIPDARSYHGHDGMIEALLDWPNQWENFRVEPKRIYSPGDERIMVEAVHRGRSRTMGIDVAAEIVWLFTFRDGRTRRWQMFMTVEDALAAVKDSGS